MSKVIFVLLAASSAYAGQSLIADGFGSRFTIPDRAPYKAVCNFQLNIRIHDFAPFTADAAKVFHTPTFNLRGYKGASAINIYVNGLNQNVPLSKGADVTFRVRRICAAGTVTFEAWDNTNGSKIFSFFDNHQTTTPYETNREWTNNYEPPIIGDGGTHLKIAWVRWSSNPGVYESPMPPNTDTAVYDLGRWEFEGSPKAAANSNTKGALDLREGLSGHLDPVPTPVRRPILQIGSASGNMIEAGTTATMQGVANLFTDDVSIPHIQWQQLSGPTEAIWGNPRALTTTVKGLVNGAYTFRLTIRDATGAEYAATRTITAQALDSRGLPFQPTNLVKPKTIRQPFELMSGASKVRMTVMTPSGGIVPPMICTASPCSIQLDSRQKTHVVKVEQLAANNAVLRASPWTPIENDAGPLAQGNLSKYQRFAFAAYAGKQSPKSIEYALGSVSADGRPRMEILWGANGLGEPVHSYNPQAKRLFYNDWSVRSYAADEFDGSLAHVFDYARSRGIPPSRFLVKAKLDYSYPPPKDAAHPNGSVWAGGGPVERCDGYDRFGAYVRDGRQPRNAVLTTSDGASFSDVSDAAWDKTGAPCGGGATPVPVASQLWVGEELPFDRWVITIKTGKAGYSPVFEYSTGPGTWSTLSVKDGTSGFTTNGSVVFTPPREWKRVSYSNGSPKYWARMRLTGTGTQTPVLDSLRNDTYHGTNATDFRGWDPTSPTIINAGTEFEYNPAPPPKASAHFPWQAWVGGTWSYQYKSLDHTATNPNDPGEYIVRSYFIHLLQGRRKEWDGSMFDDGSLAPCSNACIELGGRWDEGRVQKNVIAGDAANWYPKQGENFVAVVNAVKDRIVGVNSANWPVVKKGKLAIAEGVFVWYAQQQIERTPFARCGEQHPVMKEPHLNCSYSAGDFTYNDVREPADGGTNTNHTTAIFQWVNTFYDAVGGQVFNQSSNLNSTWYYWDFADRLPIYSYAAHMIGASQNAVFVFNQSGPTYGEIDDVDVYDVAEGTLTGAHSAGATNINCACSGLPSGSYKVTIELNKGKREDVYVTRKDDTHLTLSLFGLHYAWQGGERIRRIRHTWLSVESPSWDYVHRYRIMFPAEWINLGNPLEPGNFMWKAPSDVCDKAEDHGGNCSWAVSAAAFPSGTGEASTSMYGGRVWKREFENAIVLVRSGSFLTAASHWERKSVDLLPSLPRASYYWLHADGRTDPAPVKEVKLRVGEAAILMKSSVF